MKKFSGILFLLLVIIASKAEAQFEWDKLTYYHSTGNTTEDIQNSYQIEIHEAGTGKLEYTKYGRTNIYDFTPSRGKLRQLNGMISSSGILDADTSDLRGSREFKPGPVYVLTVFVDKPAGWRKRKHPVVIVQTDVSDKYREKSFRIYENIEGIVPTEIWEQAFSDAEKNKKN